MFEQTNFTCPSCLAGTMSGFLRKNRVPVHCVMNIHSRQEALNFSRGDIHLGFCPACGFIANMAFDPAKIGYSPDCEESQGFSPTFKSFLEKTAADLIEKHGLHGKKIVEIGCGKGDFLRLLCRMGRNHGIGIDPAWDPKRETNTDPMPSGVNLKFIPDYYSEKYRDLQGDIICCRMTLEHIHNPHQFVRLIRTTLDAGRGTPVFFQVPDTLRILEACAFEDIYYEHCSYFTPGSLARLFRSVGFEILQLKKVYDGQYIMLEARPLDHEGPAHSGEDNPQALESLVTEFIAAYTRMLAYWKERIQTPKTVLWGSGSKAVAFLNALDQSDTIQYVVDINPYRQNTFMAGTGQAVVAPEFLKSYGPNQVIIMNRIYRNEISKMMGNMGLRSEITALGDDQDA